MRERLALTDPCPAKNTRHKRPASTLRGISAAALACAAILALSALSASCWGKREIEEHSFIHLMGVDKGEKERIRVTVTVAVPRMLGGSKQRGARDSADLILSSEGRDVTDALNRIESVSSRELTGMHIACLIMGEEFAREDTAPIIDVFSRSINFRPNTLVAVCRGKASNFIQKMKSPEEVELSDYLTKLIATTHESLGFCPLVTMHDFSVRYQTVETSPWTPLLDLASTSPDAGGKEDSASRPTEDRAAPAVVSGAALFSLKDGKHRMVGQLDAYETRAALLLAGAIKRWSIDFKSPEESETITVVMRHSSTRIRVNRKGDDVAVRFILRVSGSIDEFVVNPAAPPTTNQIRIAAARTLQELIQDQCRKALEKMKSLDSDAVGLGRSVHGTFLTQTAWDAYDWPSRFSGVFAEIEVKAEIFSTGFSFQRAYPR